MLVLGLAVAGMAGAVSAADFTATEPSTRDIRDALLGGAPAGHDARDLNFLPSTERRASLAVPFELNSARLTPSALVIVDRLSAAIMDPALSGARILIEGHTDASGPYDYNMRLSAQRAMSVVAALRQRGVPDWRLSSVGRGPTRPLPDLSPHDSRNRRVDALVLSQ